MGQEIGKTQFTAAEFERSGLRLAGETCLLGEAIQQGRCSSQGPVTGFELEAWLVDSGVRINSHLRHNFRCIACTASPYQPGCSPLALKCAKPTQGEHRHGDRQDPAFHFA